MALRAKRPCNAPLCPALVSGDQRYCPKHAPKEKLRQYEEKKQDGTYQLYQTPRWRKFRAWFLRLNPICMKVIDGRQCEQIANTVHHRRGLRSHPQDLCAAQHCAAVCGEHHHSGDGDRPGDQFAEAETRYSLEPEGTQSR